MHSRIFCLVSNSLEKGQKEEEIENFKDLTEMDIMEDTGIRLIADYVSDETDLADDLEWLGNTSIYSIDGTTVKINIKEVEKYFDEKVDKLKECVNNIANGREFVDYKSYDIERLAEDKFGFQFILDDTYSDYNEDEFLASILREYKRNENTCLEFEVVKTFDYHW